MWFFFVLLLPQFIWEGSDSLGEPASLLTGVLADHYYPPNGFNFDQRDIGEETENLLRGKDTEEIGQKVSCPKKKNP